LAINAYLVNAFSVGPSAGFAPRVVAALRSNPGLKLANAFGVIAEIFKLTHYLRLFSSRACGASRERRPAKSGEGRKNSEDLERLKGKYSLEFHKN
jgi:hypothetical protein